MQTQTAIKTNTIHNQNYGIYNKDKTSSKYLSIVMYYCKLLSLLLLPVVITHTNHKKEWWERFSNSFLLYSVTEEFKFTIYFTGWSTFKLISSFSEWLSPRLPNFKEPFEKETLKLEYIQRSKQNDMWILEACHLGSFWRKEVYLSK